MGSRPKLDASAIRAEILAQADRRAPKTLCPSEVARALGAEWRALMPEVRAIADALAAEGEIIVTQRGQVVRAGTAKGPIRLGRLG